MLAAIDIHKAVFQAVVLDLADGEITEERFEASRESLVAWSKGQVGYPELGERVNRLASALRVRGLASHDRVAALCPNVPALLELHHGVPAAGRVLVAVNTRLGSPEIGYILEHSGARMLFVDAELESMVPELPRASR